MKSFKPFDFKFVFALLILMAEDPVPKVSDMGDIGDQNYLPGGGETDTRVHTILPRLPLFSGETKNATFDLWCMKSNACVQKIRGRLMLG